MSRTKRILISLGVGLLAVVAGLVLSNPSYYKQQLLFLFGQVGEEQSSQAPASQPEKGEPNLLRIPSLAVVAPIQYVNEVDEQEFQKALQNGVVHYPNTALIGQPGNVYIFGHSSDFATAAGNFKTVFALLPNIEVGAEILLSDPFGNVFHYVTTEKFVANNDDVQLLDQKEYQEKLLTLQTSYPIGTALQRYIVIARLLDSSATAE